MLKALTGKGILLGKLTPTFCFCNLFGKMPREGLEVPSPSCGARGPGTIAVIDRDSVEQDRSAECVSWPRHSEEASQDLPAHHAPPKSIAIPPGANHETGDIPQRVPRSTAGTRSNTGRPAESPRARTATARTHLPQPRFERRNLGRVLFRGDEPAAKRRVQVGQLPAGCGH